MRVPPPGSGSNRGLPHAGELFSDRQSESQAFKASLASFRRLIDQDDEVGVARHNVLTFHGLGGIGKTALSERLESWVRHDLPLVNGWGPPPTTKVDATARMDLHSSAGRVDLLSMLLSLRSGVARIRRHWPLFDLAFAAYWSAIRPGEPLPQFRGDDEYSDLVADTAGEILKDLGSAVDWIVGTPIGIGVWSIRRVVSVLRRRHDVRLGLNAYVGFEEFLLRCADEPSPTEARLELACAIAATLSWELSSIKPSPLLAVFIDTAERLTLDPRRQSEIHLNRLIHDMPNVLFVISGRNLLDWHMESRVDLPFRGPWSWPGLIPRSSDVPHQNLVGGLSVTDARNLVVTARDQHTLPIGDNVIDELVRASHGLPQYLELALQIAVTIRDSGTGQMIRVEDVTGSLSALVRRVLDDIPADEQRAIRAACLFKIFDTDLIAAAADVDHGCAERAVTRPMVDRHDGDRFPYRMHDAVREAVRWSGHDVADGWSERDWELAAQRAASAARRLHDDAKAQGNNREVLDAIGITVGLACGQETVLDPPKLPTTYADWLSRAIVYSPSIEGLRSRTPSASRTEYGKHVLAFIAAKCIDTPVDERVRMLREIAATTHPLWHAASRHLGYTLKTQHRWTEALATFDQLSERMPTTLNRGQRPLVLALTRRFIDARDAAAFLPVKASVTRTREYSHGRPERYFSEIVGKLDAYREAGRQREYLDDLAIFVYRRAFFHGDVTDQEIDELRETAELAGNAEGIRGSLMASVFVRRSSAADRKIALERIRRFDEAYGLRGTVGFRYAFAECCDALLANEPSRLGRLHDEILQVDFRTRQWIPIECFLADAGHPLPDTPTQWFEPYSTVRQRWSGHMHAYLSRHRAS